MKFLKHSKRASEMTNLIKYQRSYDAAARVVTTVDALFQTLLNIG